MVSSILRSITHEPGSMTGYTSLSFIGKAEVSKRFRLISLVCPPDETLLAAEKGDAAQWPRCLRAHSPGAVPSASASDSASILARRV